MKLATIAYLILINANVSISLLCYRKFKPISTLFSQSFKRITISPTFLRNNEVDDETPRLQYVEAANQPTISVLTDDELKEKRKPSPAAIATTNKSQIKKSSTFGSLSVSDLRPRQDPAILRGLKPNSGKEDLNGIQPMTPLSFSIVPLGMSIVGWQLTTYLAGHFAIQYVDSDIYPIQRAAIVARNLIIGTTTLATGFCAVISLGLMLLGITVAVGVANGKLDPNKPRIDSTTSLNIDPSSTSSSDTKK
mmetsp:Transcript_13810/g.20681  ORF Transcript_13810/g.20681 Transcript_13810/m.20681 type:complete len:250 (+) Transcript_13810:32-781(+)